MTNMGREQLLSIIRQQIAGYHDGNGAGAEAVLTALAASNHQVVWNRCPKCDRFLTLECSVDGPVEEA